MKVIAISGKAGSGKTTLARNILDQLEETKSIALVKFADPIYEIQDSIQGELNKSAIKDRPLMLKIGEIVKQNYGEEVFTETLVTKLKELEGHVDIAIIDDMRFGHELEALYGSMNDLITVRLDAPEHILDKRVGVKANRDHISEIDLDNAMFDMYINVVDKNEKETVAEVINEII